MKKVIFIFTALILNLGSFAQDSTKVKAKVGFNASLIIASRNYCP